MQLTGPSVWGPPKDPKKTARTYGASPSHLALAWLLHRSPVMPPIPGTSRVSRIKENTQAARIALGDAEYQALSQAARES
ncbi:aldo/keto reductase [Streptomyces milbemycinicus]|uniref:aldo/keto reductase n=1 Tax=Streptomyces milbemycinicus TaxID=476552 RepID=UPI0033F46A02